MVADTWVPSNSRLPSRIRSRSPQRRSRSPSFRNRDTGYYARTRSPPPLRRFSPRRDGRPRSPLQTSWRPRSPFLERGPRPSSRGRTPPSRLRETPPSHSFGPPKRGPFAPSADNKYPRTLSPPRNDLRREVGPGSRAFRPRSRSPYQGGRRERRVDYLPRRSPPSPLRYTPSTHNSTTGFSDSIRRFPLGRSENPNTTARHPRTRSPGNPPTPYWRYPKLSGPAYSSRERTPLTDFQVDHSNEARHRPAMAKPMTTAVAGNARDAGANNNGFRSAEAERPGCSQSGAVRSDDDNNRNQAKSQCASPGPTPPSGPSHGVKPPLPPQSRGNISLLSAPTRPRGESNPRENSWSGTPPVRRGPMSTTHLSTSGGRGSVGTVSSTEIHRPARPSHPTPAAYTRVQKFTNHLAGLTPIIPGGKFLTFSLDPAIEKRLQQLEADREKLLGYNMEKQKSKRLWLRNWDQLGRESSISALKSELAESHLQNMAEGENVHGVVF